MFHQPIFNRFQFLIGLSFGVSILLRLFAGVIIWVFVFGVSLCGLGGSVALWLTWWKKNGGNVDDSPSISPTSLMVISIGVSLITVSLYSCPLSYIMTPI